MPDLDAIYQAVLTGDAKAATEATKRALEAGADPLALVQEAMSPAMKEVGRRFECNDYFVPELLLSARAMKKAMELVRPLLAKAESATPSGRVVIGTVRGDLHDIGKNLVAGLLEGNGWEVIDLGVNVTPEQFVAAVRERKADILAMSALLTTTMPAMKSTMEALVQSGIRGQIKVLIGGAPVSQEYANDIGADAYGDSASGAVAAARKLRSASA